MILSIQFLYFCIYDYLSRCNICSHLLQILCGMNFLTSLLKHYLHSLHRYEITRLRYHIPSDKTNLHLPHILQQLHRTMFPENEHPLLESVRGIPHGKMTDNHELPFLLARFISSPLFPRGLYTYIPTPTTIPDTFMSHESRHHRVI